jgi:23S rRNA (uracil1939-C5)-methyltransferase
VYGGAGLARHHGQVVFVPFSAPGDRLFVHPVGQKKGFARAAIDRIIEPGPARTNPFCRYFGICGGCQWQNLAYGRQLEAKRDILTEILHHRLPQTREICITMKASPEVAAYRSRARIQLRGFGSRAAIGFFGFQSHDVKDIEACPLFRPTLNAALAEIRVARAEGKSDLAVQELDLACSEEDGLWASAASDRNLEEGFSSLGKPGDDQNQEILLHRKVGEFAYLVSPSVFFQANDFMIGELVSIVLELIPNSDGNSALDLFSGAGLMTLPLARRFRSVMAVENSPRASRLCVKNASAAGLHSIRVACSDAAAWLKALSALSPPALDLVVLDPPRSGAGAEVMRSIQEWAPETVIYVACDPHTLCRDVALLPSREYRIDVIAGLDLFPQTYHFETILRLRRR